MGDSLCALDGGSLAEAPLAAVLIEALRARATGELRLEARGGASKIYLRGGQPCGAQVFFAFKSLGQFLLEQGWIDMEALDRSLAKVAEGQKQGQALLELGVLDEARLKLGLALHHQAHIRNLASTTEGTYAFSAQPRLPDWTEEIRISAHRCIFDALAEAPGRAIARRILGRIAPDQGLKLRDGWEKFAAHFQLDAAETELAALLAVSRRPEALVSSGRAAAERAEPLCAAFLLMGLGQPAPLDPSPIPSLTAPEPPAAPPASGGRTEGAGAAVFSVVASPAAAAPPPKPTVSAEDRSRKMREAQERELAQMEAQKQAEAQEEARMRASWEAEERVRREEALKAPRAEFRSDEAAAKERRLRMLKRAFGQIPGGLRMERPEAAEAAATPAAATPPPVAAPNPAAIAALSPEDKKLARTIEERAAKIRSENFFERLTVTPKSSRDQVKQAYFAAAKSYHPDKIPQGLQHLAPKMKEIFAAMTEAWEVLQDEEQRRRYERELKALEASGGLTRAQRDELELQIVKGEMAVKKRAWGDARRAYEAAVKLHARPDLQATAVWCRYNDPETKLPLGDTRKALAAIASANPNTAVPHYFLGVLARIDGDTDRAESHFQTAVRANPKHAEANQELRLLQLRKGKG